MASQAFASARVPSSGKRSELTPLTDARSRSATPTGEYSGAGDQFEEVSMLPSPRLDSDSGVFEAFSGAPVPPLNSVSRAPSLHRRALLNNQQSLAGAYSAGVDPGTARPKLPALATALSPSEALQSSLGDDIRVVSDMLSTIREVGPLTAIPMAPSSTIPKSSGQQAREQIVLPKRGDPRPGFGSPGPGAPSAFAPAGVLASPVELRRPSADVRPDYNRSLSLDSSPRVASGVLHREVLYSHTNTNESSDAATSTQRGGADLSRNVSAASMYRKITAGGVKRFADKEDVYVAYDSHMRKGAWDRLRFLGKGSFSQVILAMPTLSQVRPERLEEAAQTVVAVKITELGQAPISERAQLEEALRRDVELVKALSHPSLVSLIAFNIDTSRALVVLPYSPGGDMFDLVAKHRAEFSEALVRRMFADVVSAVAYLHKNFVAHRDIKLENVLIDIPVDDLLALQDPLTYPHPIAVLTDLGLARKFDPENPLLTTRCGSEDYVPPELLMGQPYDGRQTDSWAVGVLLYAMLEGRLPFDPPPHGHPEGARARMRTVHRIARVDWAWYKRKEADPVWDTAKDVVSRSLRRRDQRLLVSELVQAPWIAQAVPARLTSNHPSDMMDVFSDGP